MVCFIRILVCLSVSWLYDLPAFADSQPSPLQFLFQEYKEDTNSVLAQSSARDDFYRKWIARFQNGISSQSKDDPGLLQVLCELIALQYAANDRSGAIETARYVITKYPRNPIANYEKVNLATMLFYANEQKLGNADVVAAFSSAYSVLNTQPNVFAKADFYQKYITLLEYNKQSKSAEGVSTAFVNDLNAAIQSNGSDTSMLLPLLTWATEKRLDLDISLNSAGNVKRDLMEARRVNGLTKARYVIESGKALFTQHEDFRNFVLSYVEHIDGPDKISLLTAVAHSYQEDGKYANAAKYYSDCLQGFDLSDGGIAAMSLNQIKSLKDFLPDLILCLQRSGMEKEADELGKKYLNPKIKEE